MTDGTTLGALLERALVAYAAFQEVGEAIEDEWGYIQDLTGAWRDRLSAVVAARGSEPVAPHIEAAVERVIAEVALITDPHRAIDWLSTFPQVVLVAVGEGL